MELRNILFDGEGRLRSGWRFAIFLAAFVFAGSVLNSLLVSAFVSAGYDLGEGSPVFLAAGSLVSLVLALAVGYYCGKYLEGLPFSALGASPLPGWFRNLSIGLLLGLITLGIAVGIGVAAGGISFRMNAVPTSAILSSLATAAIVFALAAAFEEALFRGYILQTFARSGLAWFAILLTSAFFASVHLMNPGAGEISTVNTALAGIWFGVAYLKTRDLWFVTGVHFMWNWAQGSLLGIEVSGLTKISREPLLREIEHGPAWLTGGSYGIEAGIITTIALILSTAAIPFLPFLKRAQVNEITDPDMALEIQNPKS